MLDKLKQMKQLYDLQKKIKKEMEQISVTIEEAGGKIKVTMNGEMKVMDLSIDPFYLVPEKGVELQNMLKRAISNGPGRVLRKRDSKLHQAGVNNHLRKSHYQDNQDRRLPAAVTGGQGRPPAESPHESEVAYLPARRCPFVLLFLC